MKWPNDVWVGRRKLSGSIVNFESSTNAGVGGIGVNVNGGSSDDDADLAAVMTSIAREAGQKVSRGVVIMGDCYD